MPKLMDEFVASLHIPAFEVQSNRVWDWDLTFLLGTGPPHWAVRGASQVHGSVKDRQVGKTIYLCICWPLSYFPTCRPLQTKLLSLLVRIWLCLLGAPKMAKQHLHYIVFNEHWSSVIPCQQMWIYWEFSTYVWRVIIGCEKLEWERQRQSFAHTLSRSTGRGQLYVLCIINILALNKLNTV